MLKINSNYSASFAANAAKNASKGLDSAMEKLSTGLRLNYAKDDAAGLSISVRLTAETEGLAMASRNAADAQSLVDTVDGALNETHTILLRMRELSLQTSNDTLTNSDRQHVDAEFQQLKSEIDRIANNTTWAGMSLLNGTEGSGDGYKSFSFHVGSGSNQKIDIQINNMSAENVSEYFEASWNNGATVQGVNRIKNGTGFSGPAYHDLGISEAIVARTLAIPAIDAAIKSVSAERAKLGAVSNRLASTMSNLDQISVNLASSNGRIKDADFALETSNLAKSQILQQAATAMLSQANANKASVLSLIRG